MPFRDPDPTDPNMLVGVVLPAGAEATRDMAYVFAEEFARLGYSREQLLWLFKNPFYGGAYGAYRTLGESETLSIIDECLNVWGSMKVKVQDVQTIDMEEETVADVVLSASESSKTESEIVRPTPKDNITKQFDAREGRGGSNTSDERSE
jgi:hypothetical protein